MRTLLGVPIVAVLLAAARVEHRPRLVLWRGQLPHIGCCEPASYGAAKQQCYTVMKTCREVVYEKQQYTCYKKCYETVYDTKTIDCCKMVPETHYRECTLHGLQAGL